MARVYDMAQWEQDGTLRCEIGQVVADDVIWQLVGAVPPTTWCAGLFQLGEPEDADAETGADLFGTFVNEESGWVYKGNCLEGKTENRQGYYEKFYKKILG